MTKCDVKKILIVDDEEKLRTLLSRIISLEGFEVFQAADCKSALKKLEQDDISVVLCDVKLPDGNGVELTKEIKDKSKSKKVNLSLFFSVNSHFGKFSHFLGGFPEFYEFFRIFPKLDYILKNIFFTL